MAAGDSYAEDEIWQWLVANSEITTSSAGTRSRTATAGNAVPNEIVLDFAPPKGPPAFPSRPMRRPVLPFTDNEESDAYKKKPNEFTLHVR